MKAKVYNQSGVETGMVDLPETVFGVKWNSDLVHQVVMSMEANARTPVAHTKDRGEVRGGGKKPWRQKGTGRARHGSSRSPIWVGGGVTFGPRNERSYKTKINKKMRVKALFSVLSQKLRDSEILFVDKFMFKEPKTALAKATFSALSKVEGFKGLADRRKNRAYIALGDRDVNVLKSFNNFSNVESDSAMNLNPMDVLKYRYLIIEKPEETVKFFSGRMNPTVKTKTK